MVKKNRSIIDAIETEESVKALLIELLEGVENLEGVVVIYERKDDCRHCSVRGYSLAEAVGLLQLFKTAYANEWLENVVDEEE